jgi:probable F420-dependent oxidoreductase
MKFWQSLFLCEGDQIIEATKIADEVGFDGALVSDHLLHIEEQTSTYLYSADGKPPQFSADTVWPECWSLMAALAAVTKNLRFATNVFILPLRNPIEVAKATGSVAYFSNNRIILGAGAGWMKEEFDVMGVDFKSRGKRYDECIEVIRLLQSGKKVSHHGQFFNFDGIQMTPAPSKPVPIFMGGLSAPALRRTAELGDGWLGPGQTLEDAITTAKELTKLRADVGRGNQPLEIISPVYGQCSADDYKRMEDAGISGTVSFPFAFTIGPNSTLDQKRAYMEGFANHVIAQSK